MLAVVVELAVCVPAQPCQSRQAPSTPSRSEVVVQERRHPRRLAHRAATVLIPYLALLPAPAAVVVGFTTALHHLRVQTVVMAVLVVVAQEAVLLGRAIPQAQALPKVVMVAGQLMQPQIMAPAAGAVLPL